MLVSFKKKVSFLVITLSLTISCQKNAEVFLGKEKKLLDDATRVDSTFFIGEFPSKTLMSVADFNFLLVDDGGNLVGSGKGERFGSEEEIISAKVIRPGKWISVSAGYKSSMMVREDGTLWGIGDNNAGQLGVGGNVDSDKMIQIGTSNDWLKVCVGYEHAIGLKKDGTIWGWGINIHGQIAGDDDSPSDVPRQIGKDRDWVDISASNRQSFAIKRDGSAWAWGHNNFGLLGINHKGNGEIFTPTKIESEQKWISIVSGIKVTAGIKENGTLWIWGRNYHGELGNGTGSLDNDNDSPIPVKVNNDIWKKVSVGADHLLAIRQDGTLWSWGQNMCGELGNMNELGSKTIQNKPKQIGKDNDWIDIVAGHFVSFAKKSNQKIFGWGRNNIKWLDSNEENQKIPVEIKF